MNFTGLVRPGVYATGRTRYTGSGFRLTLHDRHPGFGEALSAALE
jgi:hypothetical protein